MKRLSLIRIIAILGLIVLLVVRAFVHFDQEQDNNTYKETVIITHYKTHWINRTIYISFSSKDQDYFCIDYEGAIPEKHYYQLNYREKQAFYHDLFQNLIDEQRAVQLTITPEKSVVSSKGAHVVQIEDKSQVLFSIEGHNREQMWGKVETLVLAALLAIGLAAYGVFRKCFYSSKHRRHLR